MAAKEKAKLWLYSRNTGSNLASSTSSASSSSASSTSGFVAFKHWAVLVEYLEENGQVDCREIYEALNEKGIVEAFYKSFTTKTKKEWENAPGFEKNAIGLDEHGEHGVHELGHDEAIKFCKTFNEKKQTYIAVENNCQMFVNEFMVACIVDGSVKLPFTAEEVKKSLFAVSTTSLQYVTNLSSTAVLKEILFNRIGKGAGEAALKTVIENASIHAIGKVSLLAESPLKEWIAEQGKNIFLSAAGEMTERMLNATLGAFNPWQLLQIPVELATKLLLENMVGLDKTEAYGGSKLVSLLTSAGVGMIFGGPFGMVASLGFWIGSEIVAYLVRKLLEGTFGENFTAIFGDSQTEHLVKRMYNWFSIKIQSGFLYGIEWMKQYIKDSQGLKKIN